MKALIQNENGLLINGDSYTTPDTIRIDNTAYSFVDGSNEDIIIGDTNSGYMTALNEDGDIDQSVDLPIIDDPVNSYATYYDVETKSFKTTGEEELGTDISFDTEWSVTGESTSTGDGTIRVFSSTGDPSSLAKSSAGLVVKAGSRYRVTVECSAYVSGSVAFNTTAENIDIGIDGVGTHVLEFIATADGTNLVFQRFGACDVTLSSYTLRELPSGTTYNLTDSFSSYFTTDVPVTASDRSKLNANNNLIYDLWFGSTITGLSFTKANVINFVPATEGIQGGAYLQDLDGEFGGELITNGTFDTNLDGWIERDSVPTWVSGEARITSEAATTNCRLYTEFTTVIGVEYTVVGTVTETNATNFSNFSVGNGPGYTTIASSENITPPSVPNTVSFTFVAQQTTQYVWIAAVINTGEYVQIDNVSVKTGASYEIANYTDTCRTFYTDEVYGFQNVLADQDASGRITGMADLTTVDMIEPLRVRSPDGTVWIITVDDLGAVSAVEEV